MVQPHRRHTACGVLSVPIVAAASIYEARNFLAGAYTAANIMTAVRAATLFFDGVSLTYAQLIDTWKGKFGLSQSQCPGIPPMPIVWEPLAWLMLAGVIPVVKILTLNQRSRKSQFLKPSLPPERVLREFFAHIRGGLKVPALSLIHISEPTRPY